MKKTGPIWEPVAFLLFFAVYLVLKMLFGKESFYFFHPYGFVVLEVLFSVALGMFLHALGRRRTGRAPRPGKFHLTVSLLCIFAIVLLYALYAHLPQVFITNLSTVQFLLSFYSGANLHAAIFRE